MGDDAISFLIRMGADPRTQWKIGKGWDSCRREGKRKKCLGYVIAEDMSNAALKEFDVEGQPVHRWYMKRKPVDDDTYRKRQEEYKRLNELAAKKDAVRRALKRQEAQEKCEALPPASDDHPYLVKKHVPAFNLKREYSRLIMPMINSEHKISCYQTIFPEGGKVTQDGGTVKANFYYVGKSKVDEANILLVCEGVATSHSVYMATGLSTIAATDCGNLEPVARSIRNVNHDCTIILCADDDWKRPNNPGITDAKKAAAAVDGYVVVPEFDPATRKEKDTDWNDLHVASGLSEVKRQMLGKISGIIGERGTL